jgi:hypothetical protein
MKPLTPEQFRNAIQKGLGRALLHVREYGTAGVEEIIVDGCIHNLSYDAQTEGSRAEWMLTFIEAGSDRAFFHDRIIAAVEHSEDWDMSQLLDFLLLFAKQEDAGARDTLYEEFGRQRRRESWVGGDQIIELDGISGMLHVAEVIGARMLGEPDYWEDDSLLKMAGESLGEDNVIRALTERATTSANVQAYLQGVEETRQLRNKGSSRPAPHTLATIITAIEQVKKSWVYMIARFGEMAGTAEIEELYSRLIAEERPEQLLGYLHAFRMRSVPRLHPRLLQLVESDDEAIRNATGSLLSNVQHPEVRALALHIVQSHDPELLGDAITMLSHNYESDDHVLILNAAQSQSDSDLLHHMGIAMLELVAQHQHSELNPVLLWVYENSPCSECRLRTVKLLIARNEAQRELLEECRWDCREETRELAEKNLDGE